MWLAISCCGWGQRGCWMCSPSDFDGFHFHIWLSTVWVYICVCCLKLPSFILLHVAVQFSQPFNWKGFLSSTRYSFLLCWRLVDHTVEGHFLGSLFWCIDLCVCFCASTMLSWWSQLCSTALFFLFNNSLSIRGLFWFHTNLRAVYSSSLKNVIGTLIRMALKV